ncbi:MAG: cytochrome c-type biogenesis protein CcmH [Bryobacteraceae bacterium]|nr:cytochrome c-type biogenesis protein CcmH [Bryobacteraceae bacterium]
MKHISGLALCVLAACVAMAASDPRARKLEEMLIAPCCWSESVALHRSETAAAMRAEIETMVKVGKSDREILDHFIGRYGQRVLAEPEGYNRVFVYLIPAAAALAGLFVTVLVIRRLRYGAPPQTA